MVLQDAPQDGAPQGAMSQVLQDAPQDGAPAGSPPLAAPVTPDALDSEVDAALQEAEEAAVDIVNS